MTFMTYRRTTGTKQKHFGGCERLQVSLLTPVLSEEMQLN